MDIKITKANKTCTASECDFVHDDELVSLVRLSEGELVREDYAKQYWDDAFADGAYSVWATRFYDPKAVEEEHEEEYSPLRQLFYEAMESDDRIDGAKAFLAAQLLRRQRVFRQIKEADAVDGEAQVILYNDRIGSRLIEVRDPQFSYAELEEGRNRLLARLRELEAPEETEAAEGGDEESVEAAGVVEVEAGDTVEAEGEEGADEFDDEDEEEFDEDDEDEDEEEDVVMEGATAHE